MKVGEISDASVYLFAEYITQQLNTWNDDGESDYIAKINQLRYYFTPAYQADLRDDYEKRKKQGELRKRVRTWAPIPASVYTAEFVEVQGKGWIVWLDVHIKEYVNGGEVKNLVLRTPMEVVRFDVDREQNPWGLALNGPGNYQPQLIEAR